MLGGLTNVLKVQSSHSLSFMKALGYQMNFVSLILPLGLYLSLETHLHLSERLWD